MVRSHYGEFEIDVPQDHENTFDPQLVKKRQKYISSIEQKIISMYTRGLSTHQIPDQIDDIYGFEVNEGMVSDITNKLLLEIKDSINVAFPNTKYQRCIVHQVRNTLRHVSNKDKKEFAKDLNLIYHSSNEEQVHAIMLSITKKWQNHYPNAMKSWSTNWDAICPIFKFFADVHKVIYTTNAIESINSSYLRLNHQRSVFPNDVSFLKVLYLATFETTRKWTLPLRNLGKVYGELPIMYERILV